MEGRVRWIERRQQSGGGGNTCREREKVCRRRETRIVDTMAGGGKADSGGKMQGKERGK